MKAKRTKQLFSLVAAAALGASMLAGCGNQNTPANDSATVEQSSQNETEDTKTATEASIVSVPGGQISGRVYENGVSGYLGIPYAASTAGENRWKAPQPVESWDGVRDCSEYGYQAPQAEAVNWTGAYTPEYLINGTINSGTMSEDCLNLNVWTKEDGKTNKPVIVYIHGGGNNSGAGSCEIYTGQDIADQDVVWVSINYRVGIFGFLSYNDGTEDIDGNFAILDQIAALNWVKDNISTFGGDPSNVMIMGQSAGGMDVTALLATPKAEGLFNRAAILSGYCLGRDTSTKEEMQAQAAESLSDYSIEDLRAMSMEEIENIAENTYNPNSICVDNDVFPQSVLDAIKSGNYNKVDLLAGCVEGDITTFSYITLPDDDDNPFTPVTSATPEVYQTALSEQFGEYADTIHSLYPEDTNAEDVYVPTVQQLLIDGTIDNYYINASLCSDDDHSGYIYYFSHAIPDDQSALGAFGAFHTADVSYWVDYYSKTSNKKWADYDYELGKTMSGYLVNFAKTGDPNGTDKDGNALPEWNSVADGNVEFMHFGDDSISMDTLGAEKSNALTSYMSSVLDIK